MISLRGPKLKFFASILAVIALCVGIYTTFFQSQGFVKTTGTVVSVRMDTSGDDTYYYPTVEYTVDGKTYTCELNVGSGNTKVGRKTAVLYDPDDPAVARDGSGISIYFIAVGAGILAFIIVSTILEKRSQERAAEQRELSGFTGYAPSIQGEERELYFLTDIGTPKFGHRLEDASRRVLYEAKVTKFSLAQPIAFDFIDREHGRTVPHMVGHNEATDWGGSILLDNHYTFELDGVDVWKHLKESGVSVESSYTAGESTAIGQKYRILRDGAEIAVAETTSQYPHEEDAAQHKVAGAIPIQGFYRVWTREQNLDLLFMTLVAFARSGAGDDRGGSYGAMLGTIKNIGSK